MKRYIFYSALLLSAVVFVVSVIGLFYRQYYFFLHMTGSLLILGTALLSYGQLLKTGVQAKWGTVLRALFNIAWTYAGFLLLSFLVLLVVAFFLRGHGPELFLLALADGIYAVVCCWLLALIGRTIKKEN